MIFVLYQMGHLKLLYKLNYQPFMCVLESKLVKQCPLMYQKARIDKIFALSIILTFETLHIVIEQLEERVSCVKSPLL